MDQEPGFALVPCVGTERDEAFSALTEEANVALWVPLLAGKTLRAATRLAAVHTGWGWGGVGETLAQGWRVEGPCFVIRECRALERKLNAGQDSQADPGTGPRSVLIAPPPQSA